MKDGTERESREPLKEVLVIFQQVALNDSYPKHILKSVMPSLCPFGQEVKKIRVIFRDLNTDDAEEDTCVEFYLPLGALGPVNPHGTCLSWSPGTILFHQNACYA